VLVEREAELSVVRRALADALAERGSVLAVEAPAGQGKTALLRALRDQASERGLRVLSAVGAELERDFPFGIVRQLFEAQLRAADPARRTRLLAGAAELALPAFEWDDSAGDRDVSFGRLHGLYWLTVNLAEEEPLVLVVDDAHWADAVSLRFLDLLARRLEHLRVVLAVGVRPAEPGAEQELLDNLTTSPVASVLRPRALSAGGVAALLEDALGAAPEPEFVAVAAETTAGSPLLVRELLRTVADERLTGRAADVTPLRRALPSNVGRLVVARLRRLAPDALAVARSVAVLCDRSRPADVAALADLSEAATSAGHRALAQAGLLGAGELRFEHPIVRDAVHQDLVSGERAAWHRRAAEIRMRAGADDL